MKSELPILSIVFAAGCLLVVGCGSGNHPAVYSVSGKITYQGNPVEGAEVVFVPTAEESMNTAHAKTDASGRYSLKTFFSAEQEVKGARPGSYKVTVTKVEVNEGIVDPYANAGAQIPKHLTPKHYSVAKTTPLTANVEAKSNTWDFELQDAK